MIFAKTIHLEDNQYRGFIAAVLNAMTSHEAMKSASSTGCVRLIHLMHFWCTFCGRDRLEAGDDRLLSRMVCVNSSLASVNPICFIYSALRRMCAKR